MSNEIFLTEDGSHSLLSGQFGVSYHSKYGAVQESQHVFIDAALYQKLPAANPISILEIGFGTGLNALMTFLESQKHHFVVNYQTFEKFPIDLAQAKTLNYPTQLNCGSSIFLQLHECTWDKEIQLSPLFSFTKWQKDFEQINFQNQFDIIYFDAFAPNAQTNLWEAPLLQKMYDALKSNGILTTYCAKGAVKRCLKSVGFGIEAIPGPPGKREMTRARKI